MQLWLANKWDELRSSFWFVPSLMVVVAMVLSWGAIRLDRTFADGHQNQIALLGWTFTRGPEGSRAVLSAVAGSMMTIASVTFSITIVALQLASSQFGPRLLRNFMGDRGNQVSMGTFLATFTYSLLVLRSINGTTGQEFVPHIAVSLGLVLTLVSLGVLIYFIHHAAESIQAENVIAAVARELHRAIGRLYPAAMGRGRREVASDGPAPGIPSDFADRSRAVPTPGSDYLQAVDEARLMGLAIEHDLVIRIAQRPGKFLFEGGEMAVVYPAERADDDLIVAVCRCFYRGPRRTLRQDVEFAIDQLVEVAVRALSPGVNDPFTAINCIDRLGAALIDLAGRTIPSRLRYDEAGRLRIVTDASTVDGMVDAAFHQIRQASRSDEAVTLRLLETIAAVGRRTEDAEFRAALMRHAELIHRGATEGLEDRADRRDAEARFRAVVDSLQAPGEGR